MTPTLTPPQVATSLNVFAAVYLLIFSFGVFYIYRQLRNGPIPAAAPAAIRSNP